MKKILVPSLLMLMVAGLGQQEAKAGSFSIGISIGDSHRHSPPPVVYAPPVVVARPPVVCAPPVVYAPPVVCAPAPVFVVRPQTYGYGHYYVRECERDWRGHGHYAHGGHDRYDERGRGHGGHRR